MYMSQGSVERLYQNTHYTPDELSSLEQSLYEWVYVCKNGINIILTYEWQKKKKKEKCKMLDLFW